MEQSMSVPPPRAPESERESFLVFKWLAITVVCAFTVALGLLLVDEFLWRDAPSYLSLLLLVVVIPLFLAYRHIQRWVRFESEHRRRHDIKHSNPLIEFTQAHPYWTTLIVGGGGTLLVYALRAVGVDVMPWV